MLPTNRLPALPRVWQYVKLSDVSLGIRPRYIPVADKDVKKPNKQPTSRLTRHYFVEVDLLLKHWILAVFDFALMPLFLVG